MLGKPSPKGSNPSVVPHARVRGAVLMATLVLVGALAVPTVSHGSGPGQTSASRPPTHFSAAVGAATFGSTPNVVSPHPGRLEIHEIAPAGATTVDPAVAYDTVSAEPILNTYETLVAYNGTSTSSFVPVLSTCVPGDVGCAVDYNLSAVSGTNLIGTASSGPLSGEPVFFTFPLDPAARFYDPSTGNSWPVFPSDVAFSVARTLNYADLPFAEAQNGWMLAQALLPAGNASYDFNAQAGQGIHAPYNNTPFHVLSSFLVNDSRYCPAAALAEAGCITFVADGLGHDWPFFLDLVASGLGSSVVPCGAFTAHGATVPGFALAGSPPSGDGSCLLPRGATNTSDASFQSYLAGVSGTAWDTAQLRATNAPHVDTYPFANATGSGPYWLSISLSSGYALQANPAYVQPSGCSGAMAYRYVGYCDPAPGSYVPRVVVKYDGSDTPSYQGFLNGTIDSGTVLPPQVHTLVVTTVNPPKVSYILAHTLTDFFYAFNELWNPSAFAADFPTEPTPTIPQDFFTGVAARQFLVQSFPYLNVQNQLLTNSGIPYGTDVPCGPIPFGMGDYYPANVTCPGGNPDTNPSDVGGAAWWWAQGTNPLSPNYDPALAACTASAPCVFPIAGEYEAPALNAADQQWISEIKAISGHAVEPYELDGNYGGLLASSRQVLPVWTLGWAADYPDPTDVTRPYLFPSGLFAAESAVAQQLNSTNTSGNRAVCGHAGGTPAEVDYWAFHAGEIPTACEGIAYAAALEAANQAAPLLDSPQRVFLYNEMVQIVTRLGLYTWFDQQNTVLTVAPWIDVASVNTNPFLGALGDQPFFHWADVPPNTVTFLEQKLPVGATWGVELGSLKNNTTTPKGISASTGSVTFQVPNGSISFRIVSPSGFGVARIVGPGAPNQTGAFVTGGVRVTYTVQFGALEPLTFYENLTKGHGGLHLYAGAPWQVVLRTALPHGGDPATYELNGTGTVLGPAYLPQGGRYTFQVVGFPSIYRASPAHGGFSVPNHGVAKLVTFRLEASPVKFVESGLTAPFSWNITLVNASGAGASWFAAGCGGLGCVFSKTNGTAILARLPAGVYGWVAATDVGGKAATPASGTVTTVYPSSTTVVIHLVWTG